MQGCLQNQKSATNEKNGTYKKGLEEDKCVLLTSVKLKEYL